jgi:hypothetical protein
VKLTNFRVRITFLELSACCQPHLPADGRRRPCYNWLGSRAISDRDRDRSEFGAARCRISMACSNARAVRGVASLAPLEVEHLRRWVSEIRLSQRGASPSGPAGSSDSNLSEPRDLRTVRILRRTHQPVIETIAHASDAAMNAVGMLSCTVSENVSANASIPKAPSTVPADSSAAASSPRRRPSSPPRACA